MKKLSVKDKVFISVTSLLTVSCLVLGAFLVNANVKKKAQQEQVTYMQQYYNNHVFAYGVENANLSKGQIVFIGDSITDLYHLDDYYADLDKACYNRGIGGDRTDGVIDRLQVSLYDLEPSEVVLMIGINDLNSGRTVEEVTSLYQAILNGIKEHLPSSKVFTMSILPMNDLLAGYFDISVQNQKVEQVNTHIAQMASEKGYTYVDLHSQMKDENGKMIASYTDDGIHPNANGYAVWTNLLKPLL